jgi:hypothetical protein
MRRFTLGTGTDRKIVVIEVDGTRMKVFQITPDGRTNRREQEIGSVAGAQAASEQMAQELTSRGYVEQGAGRARPTESRPVAAAVLATPRAQALEEFNPDNLFDDAEAPAELMEPALAMAPLPAPESAEPVTESGPTKPKKASGKKKKKKKKTSGDDNALDTRVLAGIGAVVAAFVGLIGYVVYDAVLKPASIVGSWHGSMLEHEISRRLSHTRYDLILDDRKRASLTLQEKYTWVGTYSRKGDRLKLTLESEEGAPSLQEYKISVGRATLDLMDPATGALKVQLIRFLEKPVVKGKNEPPPPKDLAAGEPGKIDTVTEERLASVEFLPKDLAFKVRHPKGWEVDTGSRPDNTYSWAAFTKDSATIKIYADIKGSLLSGSDLRGQHEEGSESAPVHVAHELYKKTASEEFTDYSEGKPAVFKGAKLGEGRFSLFTAAGSGLFGSKLRGYHVTLLTNDRRVTILCYCPEKEFAQFKPTFLAVARSVSR